MTSTTLELKDFAVATEVKTATRLEFDLVRIELSSPAQSGSAQIHYRLYSAAGAIVRVGAVEMAGAAYAAWTDDDEYVGRWLLGVLGACRA